MTFKSKEGQREYRKRRRAERTDAQRIEDNEKQREYESKRRAERTDAQRIEDNEKKREYESIRRAERTDAQRIEDNEKQSESKRRSRAALTDEETLIQNAKRRKKYDENKWLHECSNIEEPQRHIVINNGDTSEDIDYYWLPNLIERNQRIRELRGYKVAGKKEASKQGVAGRCRIDTFDEASVTRHYCGRLDHKCKYCNAMGFRAEKKGSAEEVHFGNMCCNQGKFNPEPVPEVPPELKELFCGDTAEAKHFRKNARVYNMKFAFASLQINEKTDRTKGNAAMKVCGQLYRRAGAVMPERGCTKPKCIQAYFYDPEEQMDIRKNKNPKSEKEEMRDQRILEAIQKALEDNNSYLHSFLGAAEYCREHNLNVEDVRIELHDIARPPPNGDHRGRYHKPSCGEVAILLPTHRDPTSKRSIVLNMRDPPSNNTQSLQTVSDYHRSWDPCMYPLFFVHGTDGWHYNLSKSSDNSGSNQSSNATENIRNDDDLDVNEFDLDDSEMVEGQNET
eukprot:scaffold118180_cov56-Cyclotella_meneghiniana.AAC.1